MKKLVELTAPSDYQHQGRTIYLNPDRIVSVEHSQDGTLVVYRGQESVCRFTCIKSPKEVVKLIEEAL